MDSPLTLILKEELFVQRIFLSSDEEAALSRPLGYDDENDLAWERIKNRRLVFFGALRDRFLRDRRPIDEWRRMIDAEEARAGQPTFLSHLATQVLEWSVRTGDRGTMFGGFVAKLLGWFGYFSLLLGGYSWFQGATTVGLILIGLALVMLLAGRIIGNLTAERAAVLTQQARHPESTDALANDPPNSEGRPGSTTPRREP
jgi:hypothetical protein